MGNKFERSLFLRFISSVATLALMFTIIYVIIAGFDLVSTLVLVTAFSSLAGQAIFTGESFFECVTVFLEMLVEGIASIFEAIASIFSS